MGKLKFLPLFSVLLLHPSSIQWLNYEMLQLFFTKKIVSNQISRLTFQDMPEDQQQQRMKKKSNQFDFKRNAYSIEMEMGIIFIFSLRTNNDKPVSRCVANIVEIQAEERAHFLFLFEKCVKILYLKLANSPHIHSHTHGHMDSYIVLYDVTIVLLLACSIVYISRVLVSSSLLSSIPLSSSHRNSL